jgi:uncharacterized protein (DUF433 family)
MQHPRTGTLPASARSWLEMPGKTPMLMHAQAVIAGTRVPVQHGLLRIRHP